MSSGLALEPVSSGVILLGFVQQDSFLFFFFDFSYHIYYTPHSLNRLTWKL